MLVFAGYQTSLYPDSQLDQYGFDAGIMNSFIRVETWIPVVSVLSAMAANDSCAATTVPGPQAALYAIISMAPPANES